jgi:hypothetical protein
MSNARPPTLLPAAFVCIVFGLWGCGDSSRQFGYLSPAGEIREGTIPIIEGPTIEATGNFDYAAAAVARAVGLAELTIEAKSQPDADTHVYRLLTAGNDPGYLIIRRSEFGATAQASLGHHGAPELEQELLDAFAERFEALKSGRAVP